MNQEKPKKNPIADVDFSELDRELAQMAGETPEMPADFHAKWTRAVRVEAAGMTAAEAPKSSAETKKAPGETPRKPEGRRQLKYIVSAAAAFVLLIGGALLTKDRAGNEPRKAAETETVTMEAAEEDSADAVTAGAGAVSGRAAEAPEAAEAYGAADMMMPAPTAMPTMQPTMQPAMKAAEPAVNNALLLSEPAAESAAYDAEEPAMSAEAAEEFTAYEAEEAAPAEYAEAAESAAYDAGEAVPAEPVTAAEEAPAAPEMPAEAPAEPAPAAEAAATEDEEEEEETTEERRSFLQSVWSFILNATPWVLGIVILGLFILTYVLKFGRKGR